MTVYSIYSHQRQFSYTVIVVVVVVMYYIFVCYLSVYKRRDVLTREHFTCVLGACHVASPSHLPSVAPPLCHYRYYDCDGATQWGNEHLSHTG